MLQLYETKRPYDGETIFVRLLMNGVNQTGNVAFCLPLVDGLCRGDAFEQFAQRGILLAHGLTSVNAICN